jgi:hypothetical protein
MPISNQIQTDSQVQSRNTLRISRARLYLLSCLAAAKESVSTDLRADSWVVRIGKPWMITR